MENVNMRHSGCLRQYMHVYFFMACINHLRAAPSTALALLLSFMEIGGLPGCAVDCQQHRGLCCLLVPGIISSSSQASFR